MRGAGFSQPHPITTIIFQTIIYQYIKNDHISKVHLDDFDFDKKAQVTYRYMIA